MRAHTQLCAKFSHHNKSCPTQDNTHFRETTVTSHSRARVFTESAFKALHLHFSLHGNIRKTVSHAQELPSHLLPHHPLVDRDVEEFVTAAHNHLKTFVRLRQTMHYVSQLAKRGVRFAVAMATEAFQMVNIIEKWYSFPSPWCSKQKNKVLDISSDSLSSFQCGRRTPP